MAQLQTLSTWLYRLSSWRSFLAAALLYGFFIASVMPAQSEDSKRYAGDWGAPDRHVFYTPNELYAAVSSWDEAGRRDYVSFRLTLDIIWALAYTAFLVTAISCLLRYAGYQQRSAGLLNTLPLVVMLADYAENFLGIALVTNLPQRLDALAWLATVMTATKWTVLVLAHLVLLGALLLALRRLIRRP